jgi:hypothetical protein
LRLRLRGRRLWRLLLGGVRLAGNLLRGVLGYQGFVANSDRMLTTGAKLKENLRFMVMGGCN